MSDLFTITGRTCCLRVLACAGKHKDFVETLAAIDAYSAQEK